MNIIIYSIIFACSELYTELWKWVLCLSKFPRMFSILVFQWFPSLQSAQWWCVNVFAWVCVCAQSCTAICSAMNYSLPGSSVHGIFQAWMLAWATISSSRGSSWLRDQTSVSCTGRRVLYHWATRAAFVFPSISSPWFEACLLYDLI